MQNKQANENRNKTLRVSEALGIWERNTVDYDILWLACLESVEECWANNKRPSKVLQPRLSKRVLWKRELTAEALRMDRASEADAEQQY